MAPPAARRTIATLKIPRKLLEFVALAKSVAQCLTGNPAFPSPDPPLSVLRRAIGDLEAAEALVHTRARGAAAYRNKKRAELLAVLQALKLFVQKIADADPDHAEALIKSAGMQVNKPYVRTPRVFSAKAGKLSGSVDLIAPSAGDYAGYEWQLSADGGKTWRSARATRQARTTITGLEPGRKYAFRYRAVTKTGDTDWSQPVWRIVT